MSNHSQQLQQHAGQRQQRQENNSSNISGSIVAQPNKKKALQALDALLATTISSSTLPQVVNHDTFHPGGFESHDYFKSDSHEQDYLAGPPSPSTGKAISDFLQKNVEDDQLFEILELQKQHQRQQQLNRRLLQQQQKLYKEQQQRLMEEQKLHQEHLQRQYKLTQDQQEQQHQQQHEDGTQPDAFEAVALKKEFSPEHQLRIQLPLESNVCHGDSTDSEPSRTPGAPSPSKPNRKQSTTTQDESTTNNGRRSSRTPKRRYKKTILRQQAVHLAAQIKIENESRDREATRRVIARAGVIKHLRSLRSWLMYAHYKVHHGWEEQPLHMVAEMFEEDLEERSGDSDELDDPCRARRRSIPRPALLDRATRSRQSQDWDDADDENDIDDGISTPEPVIHELASSESDSDSDNVQATPCKPRTQYQHITNMNARQMPPGTRLFKPQKLRKPAPLFSRMPVPSLKAVVGPDQGSRASSDAEDELVPWTPAKPTEVPKKSVLELLPISLNAVPKTQQELQTQQRLQLEELQKRQLEQLQELQRMQQEQQLALQKAHSKMALPVGHTQRAGDKIRDAEQKSRPVKTSAHGKENKAPTTKIGGTPPLKQVQRALALQQLQQQQRQQPTREAYRQSPSVSNSSSPPPHRTPSKPPKPILQPSQSRDAEILHRHVSSISSKRSTQSKQTPQRDKVAYRYTSGEESELQHSSNAREQKNVSVDEEQQRLKLQKQQQQLRDNDLKEKLLRQQEELQYRQLEKRRKQLLQLQAQHNKELSRHQRDQHEQRKPKLAKEKKSAQESDSAPDLYRPPVVPTLTRTAPTSSRPTADDSSIMPAPSFVTPKKKKPLNPVQKAPSTENILASVRTSKITATLPPLSFAKSALLGSKRVLSLAEDKENFLAPGASTVQTNDSQSKTSVPQEVSFPFNGFKRRRQKSASPAQSSTPPTTDFPESSQTDLPMATQTMADHPLETAVLSPPEILSASTAPPPQADSAAFTAALLEASSPHLSTPVPQEESSELHKNKEFMQYFDQWMSDIGNDDASDFALSENQDAVGFDFSAPEAATPGSEEMASYSQAAIVTPLMSEEAFSYLSGPENDATDIESSELDRLLYTEVGDTYELYGTPMSDFGANSHDILTSDPVASELYDWFPDVSGETSSLAGTPYAENPHLSMLGTDPIMASSPGELSQGLELDLEYDLNSDPVWLQQELDLQQPQDASSSRPGTPALDSTASTILSSTLSDTLGPATDSPRAKHYQPMGLGGQPMAATVMANSPLSLGLYHQGETDQEETTEEGGEGQQKQDFYEMPDPSLYTSFVN
ncbi:hypothetical protein CPC16_010814 [Podila verticillata]|nr:hypothetical protein CPC16_010814 [Podila verticillata]